MGTHSRLADHLAEKVARVEKAIARGDVPGALDRLDEADKAIQDAQETLIVVQDRDPRTPSERRVEATERDLARLSGGKVGQVPLAERLQTAAEKGARPDRFTEAAKKKYDTTEGDWRTINGRRVFIKKKKKDGEANGGGYDKPREEPDRPIMSMAERFRSMNTEATTSPTPDNEFQVKQARTDLKAKYDKENPKEESHDRFAQALAPLQAEDRFSQALAPKVEDRFTRAMVPQAADRFGQALSA